MANQQPTVQKQHRQSFDQITRWFQSKRWQPFGFQIQAWQAYLQGFSGLIHAPTVIGKTYAVFVGPLIRELIKRRRYLPTVARSGTAIQKETSLPLKVLWIIPLSALATDISKALSEPLEYLELD